MEELAVVYLEDTRHTGMSRERPWHDFGKEVLMEEVLDSGMLCVPKKTQSCCEVKHWRHRSLAFGQIVLPCLVVETVTDEGTHSEGLA